MGRPRKHPIITSPVETPKGIYTYGKEYIFRLRQHEGDNFPGLWDVDRMDQDGNVLEIISQADALTYCLENVQGKLEEDGL